MKSNRRVWAIMPVLVFVVLAAALWQGLGRDPKLIPSVLIGKPAPDFDLPAIDGLNTPSFSRADLMKGSVSIVNIWASWCVPCREEHPLLLALAKRSDIHIYGINNKDATEDAKKFLTEFGNPFAAIAADSAGRATIDWGAYGVPETFIVDGNGIIRFKIIGGLGASMADGTFTAELAKASHPIN